MDFPPSFFSPLLFFPPDLTRSQFPQPPETFQEMQLCSFKLKKEKVNGGKKEIGNSGILSTSCNPLSKMENIFFLKSKNLTPPHLQSKGHVIACQIVSVYGKEKGDWCTLWRICLGFC